MHRGGTGVELVHEIRDAAALAGTAPAFEQHDKANALRTRLLLQHDELVDERLVLGFVFLFGHLFFREHDLFEHAALPFCKTTYKSLYPFKPFFAEK